MKYSNFHVQQGFIILMVMLMLALGASVWFGTGQMLRSNSMMIEREKINIEQLHRVKERMLAFAALFPEIYASDGLPGPGYFPCPDENFDGNMENSCGLDASNDQELYVIGNVPYKIQNRNFTFLDSDMDNRKFWFALDSRFVYQSQHYAYSTGRRFPELNINMDLDVDPPTGPDVPALTLDGKDEVVMVLFYSGAPISGQNRGVNNITNYLEQPPVIAEQTIDFISTGTTPAIFNDYVISITREEWRSAVLSRIGRDQDDNNRPDLCDNPAPPAWFEKCTYVNSPGSNPSNGSGFDDCNTGTVDNFVGQDWRTVLGC